MSSLPPPPTPYGDLHVPPGIQPIVRPRELGSSPSSAPAHTKTMSVGRVFMLIGAFGAVVALISGLTLAILINRTTTSISNGIRVVGETQIKMVAEQPQMIWSTDEGDALSCKVLRPDGRRLTTLPVGGDMELDGVTYRAVSYFVSDVTGTHTVTCSGDATYVVSRDHSTAVQRGLPACLISIAAGILLAIVTVPIGLIVYLVGRSRRTPAPRPVPVRPRS